jgi:hypothetical protein
MPISYPTIDPEERLRFEPLLREFYDTEGGDYELRDRFAEHFFDTDCFWTLLSPCRDFETFVTHAFELREAVKITGLSDPELIQLLDALLRAQPDSPEARFFLAVANWNLPRGVRAVGHFARNVVRRALAPLEAPDDPRLPSTLTPDEVLRLAGPARRKDALVVD